MSGKEGGRCGCWVVSRCLPQIVQSNQQPGVGCGNGDGRGKAKKKAKHTIKSEVIEQHNPECLLCTRHWV